MIPVKITRPIVESLSSRIAEQTRVDREDPPLSQREGAEFLGVSVSTPIHWKKDGIGRKSFKMGGRAKYRLSTLRAFIARCEAGSDAQETDDE